MARTFQIDIENGGVNAMMTEEGNIFNAQKSPGEVSVFDGDTMMTAENPNFEPEQTQTADISSNPTLNTLS
ncbi:MAG: hypothetical protein ACRBB3_04360 [Alphaproteobacteria bacterium]